MLLQEVSRLAAEDFELFPIKWCTNLKISTKKSEIWVTGLDGFIIPANIPNFRWDHWMFYKQFWEIQHSMIIVLFSFFSPSPQLSHLYTFWYLWKMAPLPQHNLCSLQHNCCHSAYVLVMPGMGEKLPAHIIPILQAAECFLLESSRGRCSWDLLPCPAAPMYPLQSSLCWPHSLTGSAGPMSWGERQGLSRALGGEVLEAAACFVCLKSSHGLHSPFWSQHSCTLLVWRKFISSTCASHK